jgi:flagellar biosynthesis regulator FlbT
MSDDPIGRATDPPAEHFFVNGIVAARDKMPYIQFSNERGMIAQLTIAQARQVAADILQMSARTEADSLLLKFVAAKELPEHVGGELMTMFRDFRAELDQIDTERVE